MILDDNKNTTIIEQFPQSEPRKTWRHWLIGRPLATADAANQTIGKLIGLAVFSSDALSSVAYGPQESLLVLSVAGTAALSTSVPVMVA